MSYIRNLSPPWNFNLTNSSIIDNPLGIKDIQIFLSYSRGNYTFPNLKMTNKSMTSVLFLPMDVKTLTGIISYQHPTVAGKKNGPSAILPEILAIGGFYASRGFAVIFPNYLGF
jgi:hypothetical protein